MKSILKKSTLVLLVLLTLAVAIPVGAAHLSYGTDCIAADCGMIKSGLSGEDIRFSAADFKQALGISQLKSITVLSLPASETGTLKLSGARVSDGQTLRAAELANLTFTPATPLVTEASFRFSAGGLTELTCTLRIIEELNAAPSVAEVTDARLSVETQKNLALFGSLSAYDPEGDELTYLIVSYPERGSVLMTDASTGDFRYTPKKGFTGKDSFSYVVRDCYGNYSKVATVSVTVSRRAADYTYEDMVGKSAYGAALKMEAAGIMQSTIIGDGRYFDPDGTVSRADFVVMAMKAAGITPRTGLTDTLFDDNSEIPEALRGYIATAQKLGFIIGDFTENRLVFGGDKTITRAEAAVIVARIIDPDSAATHTVFADGSTIPVWAKTAVYTLYDLGILSRTGANTISPTGSLTRAQTAELLAAVMNYCD